MPAAREQRYTRKLFIYYFMYLLLLIGG